MPIRIFELSQEVGVSTEEVVALAREVTGHEVADALFPLDSGAEQKVRHELGRRYPANALVRGFGLGRFKAFGSEQSGSIAPLTLVFGPNSSGKSSWLHGLLWLHHAHTTGALDINQPRLAGTSVDLGGFKQLAFRHDTAKPVSALFSVAPFALTPDSVNRFTTATIAVSIDYWSALEREYLGDDSTPPEKTATGTPSDPLAGEARVSACELADGGEIVARLSRRNDGSWRLDRVNFEHPVLTEAVQQLGETFTSNTQIRSLIQVMAAEVVSRGVVSAGSFLPGRFVIHNDAFSPSQAFEHLEPDVANALVRHLPTGSEAVAGLLNRLLAAFVRPVEAFIETLRYLGPLREYPDRWFSLGGVRDANWEAGGGEAWDLLRKDRELRARVNSFLGQDFLRTRYEFRLRRFMNPKSAQDAIERVFHELNGDVANQLQQDDWDAAARMRDMSAVDAEQYSTAMLRELLDRSHDGFDDLVLVDQATKTVVSHRDVGVGISQIIPVLVHALADERKSVLIEQPEIHIHPSLQAELGDVFIESALGERKNRFILETHSEHLILRVLRRIRQCAENDPDYPASLPKIRPEDVSVIYVEPTKDGSVLRNLRVSSDGKFDDDWPGGFFTERFREVL